MRYIVKIPKKQIYLLKKNNEKFKKHFEKITDTELELNDEVSFETDDPVKAITIQQILLAFGRGFDMDVALNLLDDEYGLEVVDLKDYTKSRSRLITIKGRIIGTNGKTKKTIEKFTDTKLAISGKTVSILGKWGQIPIARRAVEMLIEGAMHSTVYRWLELQRLHSK